MLKKLLFVFCICLACKAFSQKSIEKLAAAPNPFHSKTTIQFNANSAQPVYIIVKNVLGKTVYRKAYQTQKGKNAIAFYRGNLQSGLYIYQIKSSNEVTSKRFVIK